MCKYIDAEELTDWIIETYSDWCVDPVRSIFDRIKKMPPADVISTDVLTDFMRQFLDAVEEDNYVKVVRCKDCKHRPYKDEDGDVWAPSSDDLICPCLCDDSYYNWMPEDDFFCKRGERREGGWKLK